MKLFIGCLLLMVYVLTLAYKGSLNAVLTVTFFPKPMDSIQEIANQVSFKTFKYLFHRMKLFINF